VNGDTAASLGGTLTFSTTATASSAVGTYAITPAGLTSTNYAISYVNGTLTVTPAVLTITANDQSKTYGAANPTLTVSYSGFVNGDTAASLTTPPSVTTTATTTSDAGTYPITPSGAASANYAIGYVNGTLTVTPATLTVTANNKTRIYGAANPALTVSYTGFVNGDTAADLAPQPTVTTTATTASDAGTYSITPSGAASANYTISYVTGTLTVTQAPLTITANNQTKVAGAPNPALTVSYSGFVNGDTAADLAPQPTVTTTATTASPAGTYPITASGAGSVNYTISYVSGTLTITAAGGGSGPVANDNSYSTTKATALIVPTPGVLGNDTGSGPLTAVLVTGPGHGTLILNAGGSFRYTPSSTYVGTDTFRYQARDASGVLSNIATVTITISQFSAALAPTPITPTSGVMVAAHDRSFAVAAVGTRRGPARGIDIHDSVNARVIASASAGSAFGRDTMLIESDRSLRRPQQFAERSSAASSRESDRTSA